MCIHIVLCKSICPYPDVLLFHNIAGANLITRYQEKTSELENNGIVLTNNLSSQIKTDIHMKCFKFEFK